MDIHFTILYICRMNKYMKIANEEAIRGVKKGDGGPFGAVIVRKGKIIARGHNEVIKTNDPTAHAEVVAIRKACKRLKRFDISDCEIYSTTEPCPMCFSVIHWAKMKNLFYGCSRRDAAKIGFDDKFIYDVIMGKAIKKQVASKQINRKECLPAHNLWTKKTDKVPY